MENPKSLPHGSDTVNRKRSEKFYPLYPRQTLSAIHRAGIGNILWEQNGKRGHCSAPSISGGSLLRNPEDPWQWKTSNVEAGRQSGMLSPAMSFRIDSLAPEVNKHLLRQLTGVKDSEQQKATDHLLW